jgi:YHS domain-containing protein
MKQFAKSAAVICVLVASWAQAGDFLEDKGVALGRIDALSYFSPDQKLIFGDQQRSVTYKGTKFYFITNSHADAFKADPERFAPQFGGYDALSASQGVRVPANPRVFAIYDGKLYLFSDRDSLRHWKDQVAANIERANQAWPALASATP